MEYSVGRNNISLKGEFYRKAIHLFSSVIPIGYLFIPKHIVLAVLIPVLFGLLLVEALKYRSELIYRLYVRYFRLLLREHEADRDRKRINGASWLLIADVLCIIFFPVYIAVGGMLLLSLSDSLSAIIGRLYGRKQYAPNRTYVGTITFFLVGTAIVFLTPKYLYSAEEYFLAVCAVLITTIADSLKLPVDDNFVIPVVYSGFLYVLYLLFLPSILML